MRPAQRSGWLLLLWETGAATRRATVAAEKWPSARGFGLGLQNPAYSPAFPESTTADGSALSMRRAFTLIELLLVLAIIAILTAILLPVFARVRSQARRTACVSQLKQLGLATAMYRQDYDEIPPHLSVLQPAYSSDARLFVCPSDALAGDYDGNDYVEGHKYFASGVSYEYFPQWDLMRLAGLGWYQPAPRFGQGKWDDLTPYAGCPWHWAKKFDAGAPSADARSGGWELILTLGGSVRKIRVEEPMSQFTPEKYH